MPIVLYLRAVGYRKADAGKNIHHLATHLRNGVTRTDGHGERRPGQIQLFGRLFAGCFKLFPDGVDPLRGLRFEPVQSLSYLPFLVRRSVFEFFEKVVEHALFSQVFDPEIFERFGRRSLEGFHLAQTLFDPV